jgi:2-iminoacetate synthase
MQASDVQAALANPRPGIWDFGALISPAAEPFLEEIAQRNKEATAKRFGKIKQLYVPLYLSNECQNICTYCGFSLDNKIPRRTLTDTEILQEVHVIKEMGFDHVLLVTGEANQTVGMDYFKHAIELIRPHFSQISLEVQPLAEEEYKELAELGLHTVLVYQETYHKDTYKDHHPKGRKSNFNYRLDTPDRIGRTQMHKIGLGVLLGLEDWRTDSFFCALHLDYMRRQYWRSKYSISFPRLRPAVGYEEPKVIITDKELVQLISAYRLFDENLEISISTRESGSFRDNLLPLGVTTLSAGSRTDPGGYTDDIETLEQFEISDDRSPAEVADVLRQSGYEPVWKDWDHNM